MDQQKKFTPGAFYYIGFFISFILIDRSRLTAINQSFWDVHRANQRFFSDINQLKPSDKDLICQNNSTFPSPSV
jgi:hypothetical protein